MQVSRMFGILFHLLERGGSTAGELAAKFEVSERTVYRDIEHLAEAGLPVFATRGRGGGIALMEGYVLDRAMVSPEEQTQILLSLRSLAATGAEDTASALSKLGHLFRSAGDTDWLDVDFAGWNSSDDLTPAFALLRRAILGGQAVSFEYVSSYGRVGRRFIHPLRLVYKSAAWYLQGFVPKSDGYRTFRISRLWDLTLEDTRFERADYTPPPLSFEAETVPQLTTVTLEFGPETAFRIYDEFPADRVERLDCGGYRATVELPCDVWTHSYLLAFGPDVKVVDPPSLARDIAAMAQKIADLYHT